LKICEKKKSKCSPKNTNFDKQLMGINSLFLFLKLRLSSRRQAVERISCRRDAHRTSQGLHRTQGWEWGVGTTSTFLPNSAASIPARCFEGAKTASARMNSLFSSRAVNRVSGEGFLSSVQFARWLDALTTNLLL